MSEVTARLEGWSVDQVTSKEYILYGWAYDDVRGRFEDSTPIHTSGILVKDHPVHTLEEGSIVKTRNSSYLLGRPIGFSSPAAPPEAVRDAVSPVATL